MPITPWQADSLSHVLTAEILEPIYEVYLWSFPAAGPLVRVDLPATDIQVSLDGGRIPYAEASFTLPASYAVLDPSTAYPQPPLYERPVIIKAGYRRRNALGVVTLDDLQLIFTGFVSAITHRRTAGENNVRVTAITGDGLMSFPSNRTYNVISTHTRLMQTTNAINVSSTPFYKYVGIEEQGLNTPTSAQLAQFRSQEVDVGDDLYTFLVNCAATLGQWIRGWARCPNLPGSGGSTQQDPVSLITPDPFPYTSSIDVTTAAFTELERVDNAEGWANLLQLTATWGDGLSKKRTYLDPATVMPNSRYVVRSRAVTVPIKPPGGVMPASWAVADAWLRRIGPMQRAKYTGTGRAMFWLQPRIDAVNLTDNGRGDLAGAIDTITFNVDQGTQTVTWVAGNTTI